MLRISGLAMVLSQGFLIGKPFFLDIDLKDAFRLKSSGLFDETQNEFLRKLRQSSAKLSVLTRLR